MGSSCFTSLAIPNSRVEEITSSSKLPSNFLVTLRPKFGGGPKKLLSMARNGMCFSLSHLDWKNGREGSQPKYFYLNNCGTCGYELNLSSSNRNTSSIGSKYGKFIERGIISFLNIDASRFTQVDELQCMPHFSKHSWGLFRRRTKLLCRKCGNHIGNAYNGHASSLPLVSHATESPAGIEASNHTKYDIRIRSLQPSSSEESGRRVFA